MLDVVHQKMYLSLDDENNDHTGRVIARANTDGSEFEILHIITGNTQSEVGGDMTLYSPDEQR